MYGYIYKITNLVNNKIYIGKRVAKKFDIYYWGSGKILNEAYSKYDKENFSREVIEWCETKEQLNEREKYWIATLNTQDHTIGYNISSGGDGFDWDAHSEEYKQNFGKHMSECNKGRIKDEQWCQHLSESLTGRVFSEEHKEKLSIAAKNRSNRGPRSAETREKISKSSKGKKFSDATKRKMSDSHKGGTPWNKGKTGLQTHITSEETKQKIGKANGKSVLCVNLETAEQIEFYSISEAIRVLTILLNLSAGVLSGKFTKLSHGKIDNFIINNYKLSLRENLN